MCARVLVILTPPSAACLPRAPPRAPRLPPRAEGPLLPFSRRAHLKECFETLKRNIPNVDDKKTSNLSVLRTALRYIQVRGREGGREGETDGRPSPSAYSAWSLERGCSAAASSGSRLLPSSGRRGPARLHAGAEHMAG